MGGSRDTNELSQRNFTIKNEGEFSQNIQVLYLPHGFNCPLGSASQIGWNMTHRQRFPVDSPAGECLLGEISSKCSELIILAT